MSDAAHVDFSRKFGDLDDIKPYITAERKLRYEFYELFDAGNVDDQGNIIELDSPRAQYNKVGKIVERIGTVDVNMIVGKWIISCRFIV